MLPLVLVVVCTCWLLAAVAPADTSLHSRRRVGGAGVDSKCSVTADAQDAGDATEFTYDVQMPAVRPQKQDAYLCTMVSVPSPRTMYIVDFVPRANMRTAHHMILFGCKSREPTTNVSWDCGRDVSPCQDSSIMYAWARNAPPTRLPKDVGFRVSGSSDVNSFMLQVHYGDISTFQDRHSDCTGVTLHLTYQRQSKIAGIYLLMSPNFNIPAGIKEVNVDMACVYNKEVPIYPFAYRVHAHHLSQVISGYRVRDGNWTEIGRQTPLLPQAFYPRAEPMEVRLGDIVAARCVFSGLGMSETTYVGMNSDDEMCNLYIMYSTDASQGNPSIRCMKRGEARLFRGIPAIANVPVLMPNRSPDDLKLEQDTQWHPEGVTLGQVTGLAVDTDDLIYVFHRADRIWDPRRSFNNRDEFLEDHLGPIAEDTILAFDPVSGHLVHSFGKGMFYLPHGLSIDFEGKLWVTDVALHQVFRLATGGGKEPLLTLGQRMRPGDGASHFCKPTDVAVDPRLRLAFISDGYCNGRIAVFSLDGTFVREWGTEGSKPGEFRIPHALTLVSRVSDDAGNDGGGDSSALCVADRENGRVQCFRADDGTRTRTIEHAAFGGRVFSLAYTPASGGLLYVLNGAPLTGEEGGEMPKGFVLRYDTGDILSTFVPKDERMHMPHDVAVLGNGSAVFVGDTISGRVWKFTPVEKAIHRSVKKAGPSNVHVGASESGDPRLLSGSQHGPGDAVVAPAAPGVASGRATLSPTFFAALLALPAILVAAVGGYMAWRHRAYSEFGARQRNKGLNLGTFLASHGSYSRTGFDILSTEGSDHEHANTSDSEVEEFNAKPRHSAVP
ncbi:peptidyl-glycine alpha-amidating monooxygenase B-like isoform X1 [Petromyzon marinus]|uniref:Peptidyl-glycine alpha-amidating monooxygenase B-like isoform X1 n=1 Tax=Petromyzon marinus TaxID=7757 RepID=A0AAJ7TX34_PETMA|nr:peptidyl-glycine alpha-amidating monooxygenase B-like isoform X1 [Petromyzon marinus]XP_032824580.1 peptidyl-glycine alpha-amidating monooxygenase B-like isoform X1 [Petromyzon marinus]